MEIVNQAADKFKDKQSEVCESLFDLLRRINAQERLMYDKDCEIRTRSKELSAVEEENERKQMWEVYRANCKEIVEERCTEKLIKRGYAKSFGPNPMYGYIDGDFTAIFKMSSPKKATVEFVLDVKGTERFLHTFTMVYCSGKWLADSFTYGSDKQLIRRKTHI